MSEVSAAKIARTRRLAADPRAGESVILLLLVIGLLTAAHWVVLALRIPVLLALPGWFWPPREKLVQMSWIAAAAVALGVATAVSLSRMRPWLKIVLLVILGAAMQFSFASSKGVGIEGLRARMVHSGHAEFASVAVKQKSMLNVATDYERLLNRGELGVYANSKPPGTLLFYMLCERLANILDSHAGPVTRLMNLRTFASLVWPFLSYAVLIPMYLLGRLFLREQTAAIGCLLYLAVPSVNLVTLHLDGVLLPLAGMVPVVMMAYACERQSRLLALLAGVALYAAVYLSFGLALTAPIVLAVLAAMFLAAPARNWKPALWLLIYFLMGGAILNLLAYLCLHYDILTRYAAAARFHASWKQWHGGWEQLLGAGLTCMVEFSVWLGLPMCVLFVAALARSINRVLVKRTLDVSSALSLALLTVFILLLLFGRTTSESGRLWMFVIPCICLTAASFTGSWRARHEGLHVTLLLSVLLLEFGTVYFTVRHQDF